MRPLLFTFKRLALLAGPLTRAFSALVHLTPQRVDLMFFLRERPMIQRDLAFEMGVVRSVVSKMVTALEKLGLVVRRGVQRDRRLRLVTLTQRAFDLMSLLLEHAPLDHEGNCLQIAAERQVLGDFEAPLREQKVGISDFSIRDHRELIARMRAQMFPTKPQWFEGMFEEKPSEGEIASVHAYWRRTRCDWKDNHVDAHVARAHVGAGMALDFWQRSPRKRGRRARAAAVTPRVAATTAHGAVATGGAEDATPGSASA